MVDNYAKIVQGNLERLYSDLPIDLAQRLPGTQDGKRFIFTAFGEECVIEPQRITLGRKKHASVFAIIISLYALNARPDMCVLAPLKSFKEFANSMPYVGAFRTHSEQLLVPCVAKIRAAVPKITEKFMGGRAPSETGGDFSFVVYPLPKIALGYVFYEADDDFPASVTCLFSNNANRFLPIDGLADVAEYTSKKILNLIIDD